MNTRRAIWSQSGRLRFRRCANARLIAALACILASTGCVVEEPQQTTIPKIDTTPRPAEGRAPLEYERKLESGPTFRSTIRSAMIAASDKYRTSSWPSVERFRNLSEEFSCQVDTEIVNFAKQSGWELVRCELAGPVFFRKVARPRKCSKPSVLQEFEVMQLSMDADRFATSNPDRFEQISSFFVGDLPRGRKDVRSKLQAKLVSPWSVDDLDFSRYPVGQHIGYRIVDRRRDTRVILWRSDYDVACSRASAGVIVGDGVVGRISTPRSTYAHVQNLLDQSLEIAGIRP